MFYLENYLIIKLIIMIALIIGLLLNCGLITSDVDFYNKSQTEQNELMEIIIWDIDAV